MKTFTIKSPHGHETTNGKYNWLPDFVYGGIDGSVTTFAVVAGVEGASLSATIILIMGFANLFADGFSMATGKYLSDKAQRDQYNKIKQLEYQHLKEKASVEKQEIRDILSNYGFTGTNLEKATKTITANPDAWVDLMMRNEFNMTQENVKPFKGALSTFISFILIGFIPLFAYTFQPLLQLNSSQTFWVTCVSTLVALFIVGAVKSKFTAQNWITSGLETVLLGGLAATIAYIVGVALQGLA